MVISYDGGYMEIKLNFSGNAEQRNAVSTDIVVKTTKAIRALVRIYEMATPESMQKYFDANGDPDFDESPDELFLSFLEEILAQQDFSELSFIFEFRGHLGTKAAVNKYWVASSRLAEYDKLLRIHARGVVFTASELQELRDGLRDCIGDLTYAMACDAFESSDPSGIISSSNIDVLNAAENGEEIRVDHVLLAALDELFPGDKNAIITYAKYLADLQQQFPVSAPIENIDPEGWEEMYSSCNPDIAITLTDYQEYITSLDILAFKSGFLAVDEEFVDRLERRKISETFVGNIVPNIWMQFIKLIDNRYYIDFYDLEFDLTEEEVKEAVTAKCISDSFFNDVRERLKSGGFSSGQTSIFNNKGLL